MSLFMSWFVHSVVIIMAITIVSQIIGKIFIKDVHDDSEPPPSTH